MIETKLTKNERRVLASARAKGKLCIQDVQRFYSSKQYCMQILDRLEVLGFLKKLEFTEFWVYNGEKDEELIQYLCTN